MDFDKYSQLLLEKDKKRKKWFALFILSLLFLVFSLSAIVKYSIFINLPNDVSSYLLDTLFYKFSKNELSSLMIKSTGSSNYLAILLLIYWGHFVVGLLLLLSILTSFRRKSSRKYEISLIQILKLKSNIQKSALNLSKFQKLKLLISLFNFKSLTYINPMKSMWYNDRGKQWFKSDAIRKDERHVIKCLRKFRPALIKAIKNDMQLKPFLKPLQFLESFYFSITKREHVYLGEDLVENSLMIKDDLSLLKQFAKDANLLIIESYRTDKKIVKSKRFFIISYFQDILLSPIVKTAVLISIIAAVVMALGILFFKIDFSQGFLTWFAVTFGSLTVSVGVTSVRLKKEHRG